MHNDDQNSDELTQSAAHAHFDRIRRERDELLLKEWDKQDRILKTRIPQSESTGQETIDVQSVQSLRSINPDLLGRMFLPRVLSDSIFPRRNSYLKRVERTYRNITVKVVSCDGGRLPYGIIFRKVFLWSVSQAVRTNSRTVVFPSEKQLLQELGLSRNKHNSTLLRDTLRRARNTFLEIDYRPNPERGTKTTFRGFIYSGAHLQDQDGNQLSLFTSAIQFSEPFWNSIIYQNVLPYPSAHIKAIKTATEFDVYLWLRIRLPRIKRGDVVRVPIHQLMDQFGSIEGDETKGNLLRRLDSSIKKISKIWDGFGDAVELEKGRLRGGVDQTHMKLSYLPDPVERKNILPAEKPRKKKHKNRYML